MWTGLFSVQQGIVKTEQLNIELSIPSKIRAMHPLNTDVLNILQPNTAILNTTQLSTQERYHWTPWTLTPTYSEKYNGSIRTAERRQHPSVFLQVITKGRAPRTLPAPLNHRLSETQSETVLLYWTYCVRACQRFWNNTNNSLHNIPTLYWMKQKKCGF